ncbi:MAG: IS1634 family transposase [Bacteroidetes bacterium]|nr:MAG: IS1634 family transposase [Bacteroidota bacterium]
MFIKPLPKYNKKTGRHYTVYQLCESYRLEGKIRHHIIVGLGKLEEKLETEEQIKLLGKQIEEKLKGQTTLDFDTIDEKVDVLAKYYYNEIKKKRRYDVGERSDWQTVKVSSIKNKDAREIGAEWLCKQAFDQLAIADFLRTRGWDQEKISLATTHVISRAVYPASELKTVSFIRENSAVSEITGYRYEDITKDKLYKISRELYSVKDAMENYLSRKTNELFDLDDKIILYDLTNTYFEGRMQQSQIAKYGRSKEKRSDAKLIVLAAVINREGFLKYSNLFQGNMTDSKTLETIVNAISRKTSFTNRKPIVVMDAGIATNDNLKMLKAKHYNYLCVSRSGLKQYHADTSSEPVVTRDKKKQPIELMKVKTGDVNDTDNYLWVKSKAKALKENSMNGLLSQRFEEGLQSIQEGIQKKGGTKKLERVYERLGRLKQKYPSVHKYYDISVIDNGKGITTSIKYAHKKGEDHGKKAGIYFLRTTLNVEDEKVFWSIYNTIREIEYTFRVLKTDLDLRPVFHKTDDASMAHLNLGLLAYWLVSTIRYQLKQQGYNSQWREIVRTMNTQKCVTTTMENIDNEIISIRQCTEPNQKAKDIYKMMKYKPVPFYRKKSVVLPTEIFKNDSS